MPTFDIRTNASVDKAADIVKKASALCAEITGKPESVVQVLFRQDELMSFAGSMDKTANVTFLSVGLPQEDTKTYSAAICAFLEAELGVPGDRVYISFICGERPWIGWNGMTLAER
jgi:phenylpyruvate tautomerase PptA (4-oxalocrotonate tautomerase family)